MSAEMLFKDRRFSPLMWTQFFGALNDNVLKNSLVVMLAFRSVELWGLRSESLISLATLIFILPYFLFSALAGQVADKYEKSSVIKFIKLAEIFIMMVAAYGFYFSNYAVLFLSLFLMGLHSAFFGPLKYSSLPDLVSEDRLTSANAYVEVGTFIGILIGTMGGGYLSGVENGEWYLISVLFINSFVGYFFSLKVVKMKIADGALNLQLNPIFPTVQTINYARKNKAVFNSILGISWFWFLGAVILSLLPTITKQILNGNESVVTLFLVFFTIGIAVGAVLCEKLSFERVEIGLVPFGSLGMTLFLADLAWVLSGWTRPVETVSAIELMKMPGAARIFFDLFMTAIFGGVFTVPLYTMVQQRSEASHRSRVISANNIMSAFFMVIGSGILVWFLQNQIELPKILLIYAVFNLLIAVYIYSLVPEFTLRFLAWMLTHCLYRLKSIGNKNIPAEGAAVLVCNHVSYIDWLIISAAVKRPIHFVMYYKFASIPLLRYLMKHGGVIPIAGKNENEKMFQRAFEKVEDYLAQGHLVCIFPEGALTKNGELQEFKKGIEHIIAKSPVPVVPMALKGMWGSVFSHEGAAALTKFPKRVWHPVKLQIAEKIEPQKVTAASLESKVAEMLEKN